MSSWQPIETAPHETLVLLYSPPAYPSEAKIEVGFASSGREWPAPDGGRYSNRSWHGYATHWMPLPEPPASMQHVPGYTLDRATMTYRAKP